MKTIAALALAAGIAVSAMAAERNWTPPPAKMRVQTLTEDIMARHPELISATFHGVPPGMSKVYTMFGGSYLDRIGNADDPDDIMVIVTGVTILDPRWHRTHDPLKKYVVQLPLRDASGNNIGLLVLAYHSDVNFAKTDLEYLTAAEALRDGLAGRIPTYASLFEPAN